MYPEKIRIERCVRMKRIISCLFAAILLFAGLPLLYGTADAATLRNKKIVSVVYDDSASMQGPNWAFANYAMQTFVAMLNEDDELYITYMSDESHAARIGTDDLGAAVDDIRNHATALGTPYESVKTAMEQLEKAGDNNPNTQYWLVVFTDGGYNEEGRDTVERDLDKFRTKQMANGTNPQIMYMTIGDEADVFTPHPTDPDITVVRAQGREDVRDCMFDISSKVTGRVRVEDSDLSLKDDHTVTLSSNVPLFNLSILVQNKDVQVKSIKDSDNRDIPIRYEIPIRMPDKSISLANDVEDMFGTVTLAGSDQGNIPAGDYTITFSAPIEKEDIVVMLEPALQLKIRIMADGTEVTDPDQIPVSANNITAEAGIYEYGTDNLIMDSLLPGDVIRHISYSIDGNEIDSADSLRLDNLAVAEGENLISASMNIEGFFNLETTLEFTPSPLPVVDRIDAELFYDGSERKKHSDGTKDAENVIYLTRLKDNHTGIRFTVYQDGSPINQAVAKTMEKSFRSCIKADFDNYEVEVQSDGSFLVYPTKKPWYVPIEFYYFQHRGEQTVGVDINGISAEGVLDFRFMFDLSELIDIYIPKLLLLYLLWWILFKKHFPKCTLVAANGKKNNMGKVKYTDLDRIDLNWFGCFAQSNIFVILYNLIMLVLPMPARKRFCGYTFTGQYSTARKYTTLLVRNVRGKSVDDSSAVPREVSHEATAELQDKLFIRNGESYLKFYIEE